MLRSALIGILAFAALLLSAHSRSEEIRIGFVNGLSGPIAETAGELATLTRAYLELVNAQGGINGNKLALAVRDDGYDATRTPRLVEEIIEKDKVIALVSSAGTVPTLAVIKSAVLKRNRVPLVGVFSGAEVIRGAGAEEIFHTRPTYGDEIRKISRLASTLGLRRVAVLFQEDAFGEGVMRSIASCETDFGLQVIAKVGYKPGTKDFSQHARQMESAKPQAIFLMGVPDSTYQFMKAYEGPAGAAHIYTLSFVTPKLLAAVAGESRARGVGISQVVPNPNSATLPLIKDFQAFLASSYGKGITPSPVTLEGYLNIRLLVDAIRMAGPRPTGERVIQALASMQGYKVGGYPIDFSNGSRTGSAFLDIAVIGRNARLQY